MKKILLATALFFTTSAINHTIAQQGFSLSVKGTPHVSWMSGGDYNNYKRSATFNGSFGLGAGYGISNNWGVAMDVLYSREGQKYNVNNTEFLASAGYIKIPFMLTYNTNPAKKVTFIAKAGPQVSFLTSNNATDAAGKSADFRSDFTNTLFGGVAIAGAQFKINNGLYLTTAARFDYSFTNTMQRNNASGIYGGHNTSGGLEIGLKYMLQ